MKRREQQTPWVGMAYVLEHGLPGYPAPTTADTLTNAQRRALYYVKHPRRPIGDCGAFDSGSIA